MTTEAKTCCATQSGNEGLRGERRPIQATHLQ